MSGTGGGFDPLNDGDFRSEFENFDWVPGLPEHDIRDRAGAPVLVLHPLRKTETKIEGLPERTATVHDHLAWRVWSATVLDLPAYSAPVCRPFRMPDDAVSATQREAVRASPYIVYDEAGQMNPSEVDELPLARALTGLALGTLAPDKLLLVRLRGESGFRVSTGGELWKPYETYYRFRYSYALNFNAYAQQALAGVCDLRPSVAPISLGASAVVRGVKHRGLLTDELTRPGFLRTLYLIARAPLSERRALAAYMVGTVETTMTLAPFLVDGSWIGSGKYPCYPQSTHFREVLKAYERLELVRTRFGAVEITEDGRRFLDALHPKSFDPDAVHRWEHAAASGNPPSAEQVDRAVLRYFRRMKKRLDRVFPAAR